MNTINKLLAIREPELGNKSRRKRTY